MEKATILIADDEAEIRSLVEIYLNNEGYRVLQAENGEQALAVIGEQAVDLVILDVMMPGLDGIAACMQIRKEHHMPILMLSAKTDEMDKVHGLTAGADDYLGKPFHPMELIARVKSQLRRFTQFNRMAAEGQIPSQDEIQVGGLVINTATHEVLLNGRPVKLTPTEFSILELLARNRGIVFNAERIYERVWKESAYESDNAVMVHIYNLREKLEENPKKPQIIKTVWGVGYKIEK